MGPWVGSAPGRGGEGPNGVEHLKQWRAAAALLCTTLLRLAVQADGGPVHRVQKGCDSVADGAVADTGHPAPSCASTPDTDQAVQPSPHTTCAAQTHPILTCVPTQFCVSSCRQLCRERRQSVLIRP